MSSSGKPKGPAYSWISGPFKVWHTRDKIKLTFFGLTNEGELRKWILIFYARDRKFRATGWLPSEKEKHQLGNPIFGEIGGMLKQFPKISRANPVGQLTGILTSMLTAEHKAKCMALSVKLKQQENAK
jgi:hypothetical protein